MAFLVHSHRQNIYQFAKNYGCDIHVGRVTIEWSLAAPSYANKGSKMEELGIKTHRHASKKIKIDYNGQFTDLLAVLLFWL